MEITNLFQKQSFGKGQIDSDKIVKISKIINNTITPTEPLSSQEKQLMYLFQKPEVDLKNAMESELATYILKKTIKQDIEIQYLQKLIEGIDLFKKKPELLAKKTTNKKILESLQLEHYKQNQVLFNMGDTGSLYYIVLTGSVNVLINDLNQSTSKDENDKANNKVTDETNNKKQSQNNSDDEDEDEKQKQNQNKPKQNFKSSLTQLLKGTFKAVEDNQEYLKIHFPKMLCVKTYYPGESFGEIALITKNSKRTATCIAQTDCYLMTLSKSAFESIMGAYSQQMSEENVKFLRQYSFLKDLPTQKLLSIYHLLTEHQLQNKQILYSENEPVKELYFIRKGEIEISRVQKYENEYEREHIKIKKAYQQQKEENGLNEIKKQKQNRKINKRIPIVILGQNSYFGDEEILLKQDLRNSMAKSVSESIVYSIEKSKLIQTLRYYHQLKIFFNDIKMKSDWHNKRLENVHEAQQTKFMLQDKRFNRRFSQKSVKSVKSQESDSEDKEDLKNLEILFQHQKQQMNSQNDNNSGKKMSLNIDPTNQNIAAQDKDVIRRFSLVPNTTSASKQQNSLFNSNMNSSRKNPNMMDNSNSSQYSQQSLNFETNLPSFKLLQKYHQSGNNLSKIHFNTQIEESGAEHDCTPQNYQQQSKKQYNKKSNFMSSSENSPIKTIKRNDSKIIKNNSKRSIINAEKITNNNNTNNQTGLKFFKTQDKSSSSQLNDIDDDEEIQLEKSLEKYPQNENKSQKQEKLVSYAQNQNPQNFKLDNQKSTQKISNKSNLSQTPDIVNHSFNCLKIVPKDPTPFLDQFNKKTQTQNNMQRVQSLTNNNFYQQDISRSQKSTSNSSRAKLFKKDSPITQFSSNNIKQQKQILGQKQSNYQSSSNSLENNFYVQQQNAKSQKFYQTQFGIQNNYSTKNINNYSTDMYQNIPNNNNSLQSYGLSGPNTLKKSQIKKINQNQLYKTQVFTDKQQYQKQTSSSQNKNRYQKIKEKQNQIEKENNQNGYIYDFEDFYKKSKIINVKKIPQKQCNF